MKTHSIYTGVSIFTKNIILSPNIFNLMHLHNSHYISIFYAAYKTTKTSTGTILKNGPAKTPPRSTDERTYLNYQKLKYLCHKCAEIKIPSKKKLSCIEQLSLSEILLKSGRNPKSSDAQNSKGEFLDNLIPIWFKHISYMV